MDMDEEFWQGIEEVEEKVRGGLGGDASPSTTASGPPASRPQRQVAQPQPQPPRNAPLIGGGRGAGRPVPVDIIELDDSDEEKENVSTRLRRRGPAPSRMVDTIDLSD